MNVIVWAKAFWKAHGTKIYGTFTSVVGLLGEGLTYIQQLDAKHAAIWGLVVVAGVGIIKRGFTNSAPPP